MTAARAGLPEISQALAAETATVVARPVVAKAATATRRSLEDLERRLTVLEDKLFASLLAATPDEQLVAVRTEADRELAPYRRNMSAPQIEQLAEAVRPQAAAGEVRAAAAVAVLHVICDVRSQMTQSAILSLPR